MPRRPVASKSAAAKKGKANYPVASKSAAAAPTDKARRIRARAVPVPISTTRCPALPDHVWSVVFKCFLHAQKSLAISMRRDVNFLDVSACLSKVSVVFERAWRRECAQWMLRELQCTEERVKMYKCAVEIDLPELKKLRAKLYYRENPSSGMICPYAQYVTRRPFYESASE